jgi:Zn-dependent protease with chaperone function
MTPGSAFPSVSVARREQSHRRAAALGLGLLLLLVMSPLLGHHLPIGIEQHLAGRDHLWALCLVALHYLLAPVHGLFHLLFFAGFLYAVWDRVRAWRMQRQVLGMLHAHVPSRGDAFGAAAIAAGIPFSTLRIVAGLPSPAFTAGWLRPRIYVAASLPERLSAAELEAVLAHEAAHVERRDPLRLSLLRFLACMLFWLPAIGRLAEDIADEAEVRADDRAARDQPLALATALLTLAMWLRPVRHAHDGAGFDDRDLLERRVRRLAGDAVAPRSRLTRRSVLGAALALILAWTSGAVMAHPLPGQSPAHEEHCEHQGTSLLFHLFCLGHGATAARADCPHR